MTIGRLAGFCLSLLLLMLTSKDATAAPGRPSDPCRPSRHLRDVIAGLDPRAGACVSNEPCWRERIARAERLLEKYPDELHLHRAYQTLVMSLEGPDRDAQVKSLVERYGERARLRPDDPEAQYLYGRVLDAADQELLLYEHSVELDPEYPWGHWGMAVTLWNRKSDDGASQDRAAAEEHLAAFLRLCPARFQEPLASSGSIGGPRFWRGRLASLRSAVEAGRPMERVLYLPALWRLEFQATPPAGHAQVRARQAGDLARLERLKSESDPRWWEALDDGYRQLGDPEALRRFQERMMTARPCSDAAVKMRLERWSERHGGARHPEEVSTASPRETWTESEKWIALCPQDLFLSLARFEAASLMDDLSPEEIRAEVDRHLTVWEKNKSRVSMYHSPWFEAASLLLKKGLDLERVLELLRMEIELIEGHHRASPADAFPESMRADVRRSQALQDVGTTAKLAEAYLRMGRAAEAEDALGRPKEPLALLERESGLASGAARRQLAQYWRLRGEAAEARERKLDAVVFYRRAQSEVADRALAERAGLIWRELGGSDESWEALADAASQGRGDEITGAPAAPGWVETSEPLAQFELADLDNRTWRSGDLKGKAVLINVWATWCGPCLAELPHLQQLHDKVAGEAGIAVVTLNVDSNPGLVAPYVQQAGLRFPVLLAERYLNELQGGFSIPQNWIVDPHGIVRRRQKGFAAEAAETWMEETLRTLREVASGTGK